MLIAARVEIEGGRIRHIATSGIGHNGNVITDLALIRVPFERIKGTADCNVRRPRYTRVGAERIEELRIGVVRCVPRWGFARHAPSS